VILFFSEKLSFEVLFSPTDTLTDTLEMCAWILVARPTQRSLLLSDLTSKLNLFTNYSESQQRNFAHQFYVAIISETETNAIKGWPLFLSLTFFKAP